LTGRSWSIPGLLDASGRALFLLDRQADEEAVLPAPAEPHPLLLAQGGLYEPASAAQLPFPAMRRASCKRLQEVGFAAPYALPQDDQSQLRPKQEIARRLLALRALFMWVGRTSVPAADVQTAVRRDDLKADLDEDERQQLIAPRAEANQRWGDVVGWRLENMWSLAWVLGFAPAPPVAPGMIRDQTIQTLLGFLPPLADALEPWVARLRMRPESEVLAEADLFDCAHNSVRSAQQGRVSVPADFHPLRDGGVIHERRHALRWCVSPGVDWSDTDLST
jgi:hypothetical protein